MRQLTVLDCSRSLAGAYCTRMFAMLGGDVICAEGPQGHPLRQAPPWLGHGPNGPQSAAWTYLAANKRSIVAELGDPALDGLIGSVDLVVLSADGNPGAAAAHAERLQSLNPAVVVTAVSGFGLSGPYRAYRSSPLVDWAMGGQLLLTGERHRQPIAGGGPWASYLGGATATLSSQAALFRARRTGRGDLVDVGTMEATAACHQWTITIYTHQGVRKTRWGNRHGEAHHPLCLYQCTDGWVVVGAVTRHQWEGLCIASDNVELLADESLYTPAERFDRMDEVDAVLQPWFSRHSRAEAVQLLQDQRCPAGQVLALDETLHSAQLEARAYWCAPEGWGPQATMPGPPFRIGSVEVPHRAAPALAEHQREVLG